MFGGNGVETSGERSSPLQTNKIHFPEITSKSVGATCGRPSKTKKFDVIYGVYLFSVVGVDVPDDP